MVMEKEGIKRKMSKIKRRKKEEKRKMRRGEYDNNGMSREIRDGHCSVIHSAGGTRREVPHIQRYLGIKGRGERKEGRKEERRNEAPGKQRRGVP